MIKPDRYTEPATSVLRVAAELLNLLRRHDGVTMSEAESRIRNHLGEQAVINLMPAVSLLFILGRLGYEANSDSITYLPGNKT